MDPNAVVSYQLEDGYRLLLRLVEAGVEVTVAGWGQRAEDDRWLFIIALPVIEKQGLFAGIEGVMRAFREREPVWFTSDDLVLISPSDPRAAEMLRVRERVLLGFAGRFRPSNLAGLPIRELYVYPERLRTDLTDAQKQLLADLYAQSSLAVDSLPYTDEMDRIHFAFVQQTGVAVSIGELFRTLTNLRKQARLGTKSQAPISSGADVVAPVETV